MISKEYRINYFLYTVIIGSQKLSAEMSLQTDLAIGEKCNVRYILGKDFLILPEKIKSNF